MAKTFVNKYQQLAEMNVEDLLKTLATSTDGFTDETAAVVRETHGSNEISYGEESTFLKEVIKAYLTPFTLVLMILAAISYATEYLLVPAEEKSLFAVIIIVGLVLISGTMTLIQSVRSQDAAERLKSLVKVTANVKRNGRFQEIPMEDIVQGDLVNLAAGDMIPADMLLLKTKDLFITQASLTGESYPVEKVAQSPYNASQQITEQASLAFMGTNVISGSAEGIIIGTGNETLFGQIAEDITQEPVKTSFDEGIEKTSWVLIRFMLVMAPAVFIINGFTTGDWLQSLLFGISVAVGLTPEMLPMVVTSNLVKGSSHMAKEGTVIKNLNAIQNFGAIDILATDKTGTLTQDKIVLEYHLDLHGEHSDRVLRHAYLNSYFQTGLRNLLDEAIIEATEEELDYQKIQDRFKKVDEVPFDFIRRRMSVVVEDTNGKTQLITKGALEEMLEVTSYVDFDGEAELFTEEYRQQIIERVTRLNQQGLRVLGVAHKTNPPAVDEFEASDEVEMVLIGLVAFLDPPKETTKQALEALKQHSVDVKVITGDNEYVTAAVAEQVGLEFERIVSGEELNHLSEAEIQAMALKYNIFVKTTPEQKATITRLLREAGHVVGFMGDGINDAPAMRSADVGISVDNAVDIAKESADVILTDKDLMILEQGIVSGRAVFGNIMKYIKATTSSNFGNMIPVLIASVFLPFLPMLPIQLLFLGLIYDIAGMSIPWDHMDKEYLEAPKKWEASSISRFMYWFGPTSSIFDITTYLLMFTVIGPAVAGGAYATLSGADQELFVAVFHTGWFIVSLWTQTFVLYALRTPKIPFLQSSPSFIMTTITLLGIVIGTFLPFTKLGTAIGLVPLTGQYWLWLVVTLIAYLALVQVVKNIYVKRYGELL